MTTNITEYKPLNALAPENENSVIDVLKNSLYPGAADSSVQLVLDYCRFRGLDPMLKPVHIVPMRDNSSGRYRDVLMPGLNFFRNQAFNSGELLGVSEVTFGDEYEFNFKGLKLVAPLWAKCTVSRRFKNGIESNFTEVEYFQEAVALSGDGQPNRMWAKRPRRMLGKCAESLALRKAFPGNGDLYTDAEAGDVIDASVAAKNSSTSERMKPKATTAKAVANNPTQSVQDVIPTVPAKEAEPVVEKPKRERKPSKIEETVDMPFEDVPPADDLPGGLADEVETPNDLNKIDVYRAKMEACESYDAALKLFLALPAEDKINPDVRAMLNEVANARWPELVKR